MTHFKTGAAILNRNLKFIRTDQSFYKFIGWENPIFLEQSVFKEDFPSLKRSLETVLDTGERRAFAYRIQRPDASLHWVVADITRMDFSGQEALNLNIQSIDDLEQEICDMQDEIHELGTYMDIMDEIFFRYNVGRDDFCVFMGGARQRVRLFRGSLDTWEKSLLNGHKFTGKYLEVLENFCEDLHQGTRHFAHEIMMPHLVRGDTEELYLLKGRTLSDIHGNPLALGCIYAMSKSSRRRKSRLAADAGRDEMTGLLSKRTVTDYIRNTIESGAEGNYYLCIVDIDNFKSVNDNFGHMFGDEVLMTVADILKDAVGERGVVGRIGGDEMLLFLENITDRVDLKSILRTVRSSVEWAYKGIRDDIRLSCSMGAAAWPADADNYNDLFKIADKMLYLAKEKGKNRYIIYTADIHGDMLESDVTASISAKERKRMLNVNKEHLVLEMAENFLHLGMWGIQFVLEQTGIAFQLAEANVFYDEPVYTAVRWQAEGRNYESPQFNYVDSTRFRQLFNENNLAVINHTADLEFACPEAYKSLSAQHVTAALIYRMDGNVSGYVTFFREESSSRLWAESDKNFLNLIAKMIELVIGGR